MMFYRQMNRANLSLNSLSDDSLLRLRTLIEEQIVPFSAATLWRLVKTGRFPRPVKVTPQITAWRLSDVQEWASDPTAYRSNKSGGVK